jgi:hypothetical protein
VTILLRACMRVMDKSSRSRPIVSCLQCRSKKLKCNRLSPCDTCTRTGRAGSCRYANGQDAAPSLDAGRATHAGNDIMARKRARLGPQGTLQMQSPQQSLPGAKFGGFEDLELRVSRLEAFLSQRSGYAPERAGQSYHRLDQASLPATRTHGTLSIKGSRTKYHGQCHRSFFLKYVGHPMAIV